MSGFFTEFGDYSRLRSGQFSQELTGQLAGRGEGNIQVGKSQNINVIQQAEQRAHRQIDVLASAARSMQDAIASGPSQLQMRNVEAPVIVSTTTTTVTTAADNVSAASGDAAGAALGLNAEQQAQKDAGAVTDADYVNFAPPGGDDDPAEIERLLAEEAKFLEKK